MSAGTTCKLLCLNNWSIQGLMKMAGLKEAASLPEVLDDAVRYVILTCHSYVTVYIYPRYCHLKSLASYFGLQVSRTHPHVYYSFLLRTSAIQSLTQTGYGPRRLVSSSHSCLACFGSKSGYVMGEC